MTENIFTPRTDAQRAASRSHVAPQPGTPERRLAKEPQDLRLSGCRIARDCGGAVQFIRQEDARTTGRRKRATTATHVAGQHRQQRARVEESDFRQSARKSSRRQSPLLQREIRRLRLRRPRSRPPPRPTARPALPLPAFRAGHAPKRSRETRRCNLRPYNSRHN